MLLPIAIETLGPVGKEATLFVQELGRRISAITHEPRSVSSLWQRLSVDVQRGNAACVSGTVCSEDDVLFLSYSLFDNVFVIIWLGLFEY